MAKKRIVRRAQKIFIIIMSCFAILLLLLSLKKTAHLPGFLGHNIDLTTPSMPILQKTKERHTSFILPSCILLKLNSHDFILLKKLQEQGWPAYLDQNTITIGPYLKTFQSQLKLAKISQITSIPVRIMDIPFL